MRPRSVLESGGLNTLAGQLESLTHNQATFVPPGESRLKIRHTNRDNAAFDEAMSAEPPVDHAGLKHASSKIARAHGYFVEGVAAWFGDPQEPEFQVRANALVGVLT